METQVKILLIKVKILLTTWRELWIDSRFPPLNKTNHHTLNKSMKMTLLFKNKLKFTYGSLPKPCNNDSLL